MKSAQDYLNQTATGEHRGGFNSRLFGDDRLDTLYGIPQGERWGQRNAGWELADKMIREGKIYSLTKINDKEIEFKCYLDGNAWCCVGPDFENLQESDAFFGDTQDEAIKLYADSVL